MVLIPIRAPIVNLIVTVICLVAELAFLAASLWTFKFITCRRLGRQQSIRILSQKRVFTVLALFATLMFVALETLISIFSDASSETFISREDCVRNTALGLKDSDFGAEGEAIHYGCMTISGTLVTHHLGNYSLETGALVCAEETLYSYTIGERQNATWQDSASNCDFRVCSVVFLRGNTLYISMSVSYDDRGKLIPVIPTDVTPMNITDEDLRKMREVTILGYHDGIQEESDIRRRALAAPVKTKCDFKRRGRQATTIPLSIIIISATVWALSILFFLVSLRFKGDIFFDFSNPIHWAYFTWHDVEAAQGDDPHMTVSQLSGIRNIRITRYM